MFLKIETQENQYLRHSKCGLEHAFSRKKTLAVFRCDNCDKEFQRDLKHMDRKSLSNNYFHVCSECDAKKFAQRKGVERKRIWALNASSDLPISKL